jgi:hypothetical protein
MTVPNIKWGLFLSGWLLLTACGQQPGQQASSGDTDTTDTAAGRKALTAPPDMGPPPAVPDTQFIIVDSMVNIRVNDQSVPRRPGALDSTLSAYWIRLYNSEKRLPSFLRFKYQGTVMMGARGNIMDQVTHVQDTLKNHIALEKYQKNFRELDAGKQKDLAKDFPVLFQKQL